MRYSYCEVIPIGTKVIYNRGKYKSLIGTVIPNPSPGRHFNTNVQFNDGTVTRITSGCLKPATN